MKQLIATTALILAPMAAASETPDLSGNWESLSCEVRPQIGADGTITEWWLTRRIEMTPGRIEADFTTYAGPGCDVALQTLSFAGRVEIVGPSKVTDAAVEANLTIDEFVRFTPQAQGFADFLNSGPEGSCGAGTWAVGETQDILETGCAMLGLVAGEATVEYEVLALEADQLYFGARPVDGSFITSADKRPHALLVPLKRAE
ncbi:hypothetical protein ACS3SW_19550 [Roseobacteraceae bacterium S113]